MSEPKQRQNFSLSRKEFDILKHYKETYGTSYSETIRRALLMFSQSEAKKSAPEELETVIERDI